MNIGTKIIGGYVLFVVLILAFPAARHRLMTSTVGHAQGMYDHTEELRLGMEAETILWKQVSAMTDYLLLGDEEYLTEFNEHQRQFSKRIEMLKPFIEGKHPKEEATLGRLKNQYDVFIVRFNKAVALYQAGNRAEAVRVEIAEVDPAEHEVERALESLVKSERSEINESIENVRSVQRYAVLFPILATTIENAEIIHTGCLALQYELAAESIAWKQKIAKADLFLFDNGKYIAEFDNLEKVYQEILHKTKGVATGDEEKALINAIHKNHQLIVDGFAKTARLYEAGDNIAALSVERDEIDPLEKDLEKLHIQFYQLNRENLKRSLENVRLIDATAITIIKSFGIYFLIILVIGLLVGTMIALRISRPISQLVEATQLLTAGDFGARARVRSGDEVGDLAASFNRMAESLQKTTVSKDQLKAKVEERTAELAHANETLEADIIKRKQAEDDLRRARDEMESKVTERTAELAQANEALQSDIAERKKTETALQEADRRAVTEYERLLNRLASLAQSLGSARDLTTVYRALSDFTLASAPCTGIVIAIYYAERQVREAVYIWADGKELSPSELPPLPVGDGPIGRAIKTGELFVCEDLQKAILNRPAIWIGAQDRVVTRPALIAPMAIMGRVIGVLEIQNDDGEAYQVEHVTALRMAATLAATAIENVRLLELERRKEQRTQQAQKMESIGTLAGGIAHDFNNILAAIIGYSELAAADLQGGHQVQAHIAQVLKAAGRAKESVKQILTFSRHQEPDRKLINIGSILDEVLDLLRASLPTTIQIVTEIDPEVPQLLGDSVRIHQVMMNLGTNAMHAMSGRDGILEVKLVALSIDAVDAVETHADLHEGRYLRLIVSDTGCGIDPQTMDRMFEPFFTTKGPGEGTGLGLATVYGIVKDHGGAISVYSQLGEGTTFNIYFPVHEGAAPKPVIHSAAIPQGQGQHVLFVDDEAPLALLGKERLERLGYKVTTHTSSVEALEAFNACPTQFDLVITDYTMPHMNGADLAMDMLKVRPEIPVIMLTGYNSRMSLDRTTSIGVRELLIKPTTARTIGQAVNRALTKRTEE